MPGPRWWICNFKKKRGGGKRDSHNVQFETGVRIRATPTAISTAFALNFLIILQIHANKNESEEQNEKMRVHNNWTYLQSVDPQRWTMAVTRPAGMRRNTQSGTLQVNAETALWAVGRAVAVARFTVTHHLVAPHQPGKREIMTCQIQSVNSDFLSYFKNKILNERANNFLLCRQKLKKKALKLILCCYI